MGVGDDPLPTAARFVVRIETPFDIDPVVVGGVEGVLARGEDAPATGNLRFLGLTVIPPLLLLLPTAESIGLTAGDTADLPRRKGGFGDTEFVREVAAAAANRPRLLDVIGPAGDGHPSSESLLLRFERGEVDCKREALNNFGVSVEDVDEEDAERCFLLAVPIFVTF